MAASGGVRILYGDRSTPKDVSFGLPVYALGVAKLDGDAADDIVVQLADGSYAILLSTAAYTYL